MPAVERLSAERLRADLGPVTIGREIVVLKKTTSTNDAVVRMATRGMPEGFVVFAEHQTAGRGQRGNSWESAPHKGLWFSLLLRPKIDMKDSPGLIEWAAKVVADTIQSELSLPATIKMPNDVYVGPNKVAGVLVEMRAQKKASHVAVVGIGLNVNQTSQDFSEDVRAGAASLAMAVGRSLDRHLLAVALLRNLDRTYAETFG
jgi:BirA family biotin operon repressor/biotin-[acetyl-CoA-carboxylase] ligase